MLDKPRGDGVGTNLAEKTRKKYCARFGVENSIPRLATTFLGDIPNPFIVAEEYRPPVGNYFSVGRGFSGRSRKDRLDRW